MNDKVIPVIIGTYFNAYSLVREFGENGIKSILITGGEKNFVEKSKYLLFRRTVRNTNYDEAGFIEDLITLGGEISPDRGIFFPTHDEQLLAIAKHRDELKPFFEIPFSDYEILNRIMDKDHFSRECNKLGIPTIKGFVVTSYQHAKDALEQLRLPLIVKANIWDIHVINAFGGKIAVFYNVEDYIQSMKQFFNSTSTGELLVQEYVEDSDELMPTVNSFTDMDGIMQCIFVSEKVRQYPPQKGTSTAEYAVDPEDRRYKDIIEYSKKIVKHFKFYGLFGIEYKYDPRDNKYKIIEMNCRAEFPNYLQTIVGQNMAYGLYKYHLGEKIDIPFYPVIKSATCIVPVLDKFYSTCSYKYNYPQFAITKKAWKKSLRKPITLYGLDKMDVKAVAYCYLQLWIQTRAILFRLRHNIPDNVGTKTFIKNRFGKLLNNRKRKR